MSNKKKKDALNPVDGENKAPDQSPVDNDSEIGETETIPEFTKEQLLRSSWYSHRRDILNTLLEDGKMYSTAAADKLISDFMKGKVN